MDDLLMDLSDLRVLVAALADQPIYALTDEALLAFHDALQVAIDDLMAFDDILARELEEHVPAVPTLLAERTSG
jgi:hypothetical protein